MAKVDSAVVDELPPGEVETVEDVAEEAEGKKSRKRENWGGGYNQIFDDADSAKNNPVLTEAGEETDKFEIYKIESRDVDDKTVLQECFTWGRNNNEALLNVIDAHHNYFCTKLDGKRGRQKMFKPDAGLVTLLTSMKERNDTTGITQFLTLFPIYQYVIDGTEQPTTLS